MVGDDFRLMADLMPVGVFCASPAGAWQYANPELARILGVADAEPADLERHWRTMVSADYSDSLLLAGGEFELLLHRPDGSERAISIRTAVHRTETGVLDWIQAVVTDATARRLAERAAWTSETEYRGLAMSIPAGVVRRDSAGRATFVNRHLLDIAGLPYATTPDEISSRVLHPEDQAAGEAALQELLRTGQPFLREARVLRPDGSVRFVEIRGSLQHDPDGAVAGTLATVVDITRRHEAELATRAEEQRYRSLAAAVPAGILRMDTTGGWLWANDQFRAVWHVAPEESLGEFDWRRRVHPADLGPLLETLAVGAEDWDAEFRIVAPGGDTRWCWTRAVAEYNESGTRIGTIATTLDVHARRTASDALSRSDRLHRLTINNLPGVIVGLYDRDLRCLLMEGDGTNDQLNTDACAGRTLSEFANQATADELEPGMRKALDGAEQFYEYRSPRDDSWRENHVGPVRDANGGVEGVVIVSRDITKRRLAEEAGRVAEEQFRIAFEHAPIGIVNVDVVAGRGRVNQSLCNMTGYSAEALLAKPALALVHPEDLEDVRACLDRLGAEGDHVEIEHRITHAGGHAVWVDSRVTAIRNEQGEPVQLLAQVQDISERRDHESQLRYLADHDPLTGLLNRRGLAREMDAHLAMVNRYGGGGALLVVDLDGFKAVNDRLGHAAGDQLIADVAHGLRARLRETDVVARIGGDEFAVILPGESVEEASVVAPTVISIIERATDDLDAHVTASVGVAAFATGVSADEILARADTAMYAAKAAGRARYAVHAATEQPSV
jgi:diguanylate cyclase (GGDEF)-like protein/PAS domain S-box-containing protein